MVGPITTIYIYIYIYRNICAIFNLEYLSYSEMYKIKTSMQYSLKNYLSNINFHNN